MKKRTRITAKMEQKMQELRAQGKSAKEIAAVVGVSETAVRTHTTGIVVPEDEKQARVEAVRKMYTEGKTYTQIAAETGASASTIRNYTCDLPRRDRNRNGAPIPREKVTKIRELRSQGKSFEAIARQMGIKPVTAKKYAQDILVEKPEQPATGQPGSLCRHKKTCRHWRPLSGLGGRISACHYPIDRDELRPWPADQCPGFPGPKTGPNKDPMGIKPRREKP